jgi:hypothetical protein
MHFRINGMMYRSVVEYHHGRTFIALQRDLPEEVDDSASFDRRVCYMVSQRVGSEVKRIEHRAPWLCQLVAPKAERRRRRACFRKHGTDLGEFSECTPGNEAGCKLFAMERGAQ